MRHTKKIAVAAGLFLSLTAYGDDAGTGGLRFGMAHCCDDADVFMRTIAENIRKAADADGNSVIFANAEGSQEKQLEDVQSLANQNVDALLMSIVIDDTLDKPFQNKLIETLKQIDIPVVFYLLAPQDRFLQTNKKAYRVGSTPAQSGILQGEMISDLWLANPSWDKNGDGIMQYAILKGPAGNPDAEGRTKWVKATLDTFPTGEIKTQQVALKIANFKRDQAKQVYSQWIADGTADSIEVLIANNDDMMLGARDAMGSNDSKPALFGIDALPEVLSLIRSGQVAGTVLQDTKAQSSNAYRLAANLAAGRETEKGLDFPVVRQELVVPYIPVTRVNVNNVNN